MCDTVTDDTVTIIILSWSFDRLFSVIIDQCIPFNLSLKSFCDTLLITLSVGGPGYNPQSRIHLQVFIKKIEWAALHQVVTLCLTCVLYLSHKTYFTMFKYALHAETRYMLILLLMEFCFHFESTRGTLSGNRLT